MLAVVGFFLLAGNADFAGIEAGHVMQTSPAYNVSVARLATFDRINAKLFVIRIGDLPILTRLEAKRAEHGMNGKLDGSQPRNQPRKDLIGPVCSMFKPTSGLP